MKLFETGELGFLDCIRRFAKNNALVKFGFGDDVVSSEQSEGVDFRIWVLLGGDFSSHNKILSDLR